MAFPVRVATASLYSSYRSPAAKMGMVKQLQQQNSPQNIGARIDTLEKFVKKLDGIRSPPAAVIKKKRELQATIDNLKQQLSWRLDKNPRGNEAKSKRDEVGRIDLVKKIQTMKTGHTDCCLHSTEQKPQIAPPTPLPTRTYTGKNQPINTGFSLYGANGKGIF